VKTLPTFFEDQMNRNIDIALKRFDIEIHKATMEYKYDSDILDGSFITEASRMDETKSNGNEKETSNKFTKFIESVISSISRLASSVADTISDCFKKKDKLDSKAYMNSKAGQKDMDALYRRIDKEASDLIGEGDNIITKLLSKTGCPKETIQAFEVKVAKTSKFIKENRKKIYVGAIAGGTLLAHKTFVTAKKNTIELAGRKAVKDDLGLKTDNDAEGKLSAKEQIKKIYSTMFSLYYEVIGVMNYAQNA
jgi:hypothetical protein